MEFAFRIHLLICLMCQSIKLACWNRNWFTSSRNSSTLRKEEEWYSLFLFHRWFVLSGTKFTFPRTFFNWVRLTKRKATVRGRECWVNFYAMCEIYFSFYFCFSSSLINDFFFFFKEVDMSISFGPWFHSRHLVVDVSVMVVVDEISIMVPYPTQETDARGYLKAYSLWVCLLFIFNSSYY